MHRTGQLARPSPPIVVHSCRNGRVTHADLTRKSWTEDCGVGRTWPQGLDVDRVNRLETRCGAYGLRLCGIPVGWLGIRGAWGECGATSSLCCAGHELPIPPINTSSWPPSLLVRHIPPLNPHLLDHSSQLSNKNHPNLSQSTATMPFTARYVPSLLARHCPAEAPNTTSRLQTLTTSQRHLQDPSCHHSPSSGCLPRARLQC